MVHTQDGPVKFYKDENGLPYIDLEDSEEDVATLLVQMGSEEAASAFIQTVRQNYKGFTKKEVLQAKEARRAMGMIGNPSESNFKGLVSNSMITNCPMTTTAITNAQNIFGKDLASVRGKTVQWAPVLVVGDYVAVPKGVIERNKTVTLAADVFFVDGIIFLLMVSRNIKFITVEHVATHVAKSLSNYLDRVIQVYTGAGFSVHTILMDGEFKKVKNELPLVVGNTTATKEHVSKAECSIRTIKERTRGIVGTLPFEFILWRLKMEFIYFVVLWLNAFPAKSGISATYSPRELLVHWKLDYKKHCRVLSGTYCETHNEPVPSDTMTPGTHKCIACGPTGNLQGSIKLYCLTTGRILKRRSFTAMPMPDRVIKRMNTIGSRENRGAHSASLTG